MKYTNIPTTTPNVGDIVLYRYSLDVNDGGMEYVVTDIRKHNGKQIVIVQRVQERPNGGSSHAQKIYGLTKSKDGYYKSKLGKVSMIESRSWRWAI